MRCPGVLHHVVIRETKVWIRLPLPQWEGRWFKGRRLAEEYAASLELGLLFQEFGHEVEHLTWAYAPPPTGAFLLAEETGESLFQKNEDYLHVIVTADNLEEIGREFNISRFSSVSSVVERMGGERHPGIAN